MDFYDERHEAVELALYWRRKPIFVIGLERVEFLVYQAPKNMINFMFKKAARG